MAFQWKSNTACIATYKTLERDDRMNQFDEMFLPFDQAADFKIAALPFYANLASNPLQELAVKHFVAQFLKYLMNDYVVRKENPESTTQDLFEAVVKCMNTPAATIANLAETLDKYIRFQDE